QQTLLKTLNTGMAEAARQAGQDSATQFIGRDSPQAGKQPPTYKDIKFFPVLTKKDLKETVELKYAGRDERDSLRTFNLDQNFALIVTHPPSFRNITYSDYVAMKPSSGDTLYLVLESTKIANSSSSVSTGQFWKTSVYKMPRKKHALLGVIFKGDTTYYNLGDF
ncbi:MAG TPA: hypothetical protein VK112_01865, partial [Fodinibius sp.]|nr:hypothetical protein [Fodinibius sp.]